MVSGMRRQSEADLYHVVTRGVAKQLIFEDDDDRRLYLACLKRASASHGTGILAWCLMDNHTHLLIRAPLQDLSAFMRELNSSYAAIFNERHGRVGHLFQGRFKSEPIETDEQLLATVRYIHQNPMTAGMAASCDYRWSSYRSYISGKGATKTDFVLGLFDSVEDFAAFNHAPGKAGGFLEAEWAESRLPAEEALALGSAVVAPLRLQDVRSLGERDRREALRRLKSAGLTTRQIERLTGVSRTTISRTQ